MSKFLKNIEQVLDSGHGIDIQKVAGNVDVTIYKQDNKDVICECTHSDIYVAILEAVREVTNE